MPAVLPDYVTELLKQHTDPRATFTTSSASAGLLVSPSTSDQRYLFKQAKGDATQLVGEAESLRRINEGCEGVAPLLLGSGEDEEGTRWMLSEWHDLSTIPSSEQARLAELLAEMHLASPPPGTKFGLPVTTCCGVTRMDNTEEESWSTFYSERRIEDMLRRIGDGELSRLGKELQKRVIPALLDKLDVKPSLLHGDLWSGNARYSKNRDAPITFDPSSWYGHSEADLGITHMFGGFSPAFYERYHELVPKTEPVEEYEQRQQLYELFHHANHTLMFGGSYKSGTISLMEKLLSWADEKGL
ncbi:hypothetical protein JCM8547_003571 [Rhodosporidiobolus lusitaniae]